MLLRSKESIRPCASQPIQMCFYSLVHASSTEVCARLQFSNLVELLFCSFAGWISVHPWLNWLSKITSCFWSSLFFTFIRRDKVKWVRVTLNEGYWWAAIRSSILFYIFVIKFHVFAGHKRTGRRSRISDVPVMLLQNVQHIRFLVVFSSCFQLTNLMLLRGTESSFQMSICVFSFNIITTVINLQLK